jgi:hypothetical protein
MDAEFRLHKGARVSLYVVGGLLCLLIVTIPIAIWVFYRAGTARVSLTAQGVKATNAFTSTSFDYSDVARLGLLKVAMAKHGGAAGALAQQRVGGNEATHLIVRTTDGKNRSFMVSSYERFQDILDEVGRRVGKPYETVAAGALGDFDAKWPQELGR